MALVGFSLAHMATDLNDIACNTVAVCEHIHVRISWDIVELIVKPPPPLRNN